MTSCRSFFTSTILCFPLFHLSLLNYRAFSPLLSLTYSTAIAIAAIPQDIGVGKRHFIRGRILCHKYKQRSNAESTETYDCYDHR